MKEQLKTFGVCSSHGNIVVNENTGEVLEIHADSDTGEEIALSGGVSVIRDSGYYLDEIDRFDIPRYKAAFGVTEMPTDVDILRLGYWDKQGNYEEPADGYEPLLDKKKKAQ